MKDSKRAIIIGLDGATWDLIEPWVKQGRLPGFKQLMEKSWGNLRSTIPPLSPAAWTSIFTGTTPAKHSIFSFVKRKENSYFIRAISSRDRKVPPVWTLLLDAGKRAIVINAPFSYPPDRIAGIMTTGLGTPSKDSDFCYPPEMKEKLLKRFPNYDVDFNEDAILLSDDKGFIIEQIKRTTQAHIDAAKGLFESEKWDFFAIVLRSLDVIQHYYWDDENTVLQFYKQCDELLEWFSGKLADDMILIICSDHGFSRVHTKVYVNNWLQSKGVFSIRKGRGVLSKITPSAEGLQKILVKAGLKSLVWRIKRSKLLEFLLKHFMRSKGLSYLFRVDWSNTRAYFLEGSDGAIYLNLKDREPDGIVSDEDRETTIDRILREVRDLKNPNTGERIIKEAYSGREVYGDGLIDIPDIVLLKNDGFRLVGGYNDSGHILERERERNGEHNENGIFLAYGYGVKKGHTVKDASVCDIAPTTLHMLGAPIPTQMDGVVLFEIFEEGSGIAAHTVMRGDDEKKRIVRRAREIKARYRI